jgi:hypothetical protein
MNVCKASAAPTNDPLIDTVNLEHTLCQINTNRRNLHDGCPTRLKWLMTLPLWDIDAVAGGGVHPIAIGGFALRLLVADRRHCSDSTERQLNRILRPPRPERQLEPVEPPAGAPVRIGVNDSNRTAKVL